MRQKRTDTHIRMTQDKFNLLKEEHKKFDDIYNITTTFNQFMVKMIIDGIKFNNK